MIRNLILQIALIVVTFLFVLVVGFRSVHADVDVAGLTTWWEWLRQEGVVTHQACISTNGGPHRCGEVVECGTCPGGDDTVITILPCHPGESYSMHIIPVDAKGTKGTRSGESAIVHCHPSTDLDGDGITNQRERGIWDRALRAQYGRKISPRGVIHSITEPPLLEDSTPVVLR